MQRQNCAACSKVHANVKRARVYTYRYLAAISFARRLAFRARARLHICDQSIMRYMTSTIQRKWEGALGTAKITAIGFSICEKRDKVADANDIDCGDDSFRIMERHSKRHVAAVAASVHNHAAAVKIFLSLNPIQQSADVTHLQRC